MKQNKMITSPERSSLMAKIKSKNTKPELKLRKALWAVGLRYRTNYKKLPGSPDIVIKKYKLAIFIDGEFWHGKEWDKKKITLKNNREFWIAKIEKNMARDAEVNLQLEKMNYKVLRFWSLEVEYELGICVKEIIDFYNLCKYPYFDM